MEKSKEGRKQRMKERNDQKVAMTKEKWDQHLKNW